MTVMLCRNRVADFSKWKAIFDSHVQAQRREGLRLTNLWRDIDRPDDVYFLFEVTDIDKARGFISDPKAAEVGRASGVLEGECHFLDSSDV